MAKKYEFQPDKPYSTWLNKLQLTQAQRLEILKWCLCALVLIVVSVVQDVVLCRLRIYGGTTELVPCGIFLICLLEGSQRSCIFSLIAAWLYLASGSSPGPHVLVLITVLSVVTCALRQAYLQPGFLAAFLGTAVAMAFYELFVFAYCLLVGYATADRLLSFTVPALLSLAAVPILYPMCKAIGAIGGRTWKE
jgi:hypothetical protein